MNAAANGGAMVHAKVCSVDPARTKSEIVASAVRTAKAARKTRIAGIRCRVTAVVARAGGAGLTGTFRELGPPRTLSSGPIEPSTRPRCHRPFRVALRAGAGVRGHPQPGERHGEQPPGRPGESG